MSENPVNEPGMPEMPDMPQGIPPVQPAPEMQPVKSSGTSDEKVWALLAYILPVLGPILILLMQDKRDSEFLKPHTLQALIWGLLLGIVSWIPVLPFVGYIFSVIWGVQAYNGQKVKIPVITNLVTNQR